MGRALVAIAETLSVKNEVDWQQEDSWRTVDEYAEKNISRQRYLLCLVILEA
jgi:hypothetical protein